MVGPSALSLPEWVVLAVVEEGPTHGFAVAALTGADGELGRVWQIPRPVVYRSLGRLQEAGMVEPSAVEPGLGPRRQVFGVTPVGRSSVQEWLASPVGHVRDFRSQLLLKLALLDRRGERAEPLIRAQRAALAPILHALDQQQGAASGFDATLIAWRRASTAAAAAFLDDVASGGS